MLFLYSFICLFLGTSATLDSIKPSQSIRDGDTLVSAGGTFELGFFRPDNSRNRYLGIWYKNLSGTVVWVANRENPLTNASGVLNVTNQGTLVLFNGRNRMVWSSNESRTVQNPVAQLLESGNLVVKGGNGDNPENFSWQSFDYPCDTLLPGMKLGKNLITGLDRFLSSWKSKDDPAPGQFSLWIDTQGFPQMILRNGSKKQYRAGSWNGFRFTGTPELQNNQFFKYEFVLNEKEVYYTYELQSALISRLVMNSSGILQRFARTDRTNGWILAYFAPRDSCDNYALCGAYATCNMASPTCVCLQGFVPKSPKDCVRRIQLVCRNGNMFRKYGGLKLPDTSRSWFDVNMSLAECKEMCSRNCSCTAYANSDIRGTGSGCLLWFGDLIDMREYSNGQDLYIRMDNSESDQSDTNGNSDKKKQVGIIVGPVMFLVMLMAGLLLYIRKKKLRKRGCRNNYENEGGKDDMELPIIDLMTIMKATDNFSSENMLGEGGFGAVYKGILTEGQEIAVKRLSKNSGQGLEEFKNEVILIAKLQHRNLVKLLGCCIEGNEKMLIYEYMPNKSLDYFIFDQTQSKLLDLSRRMHIIGGIARGLLYLHQDSRLRIIHRDLKASNVLLDNDLNPKISDFGMARTFGGDQTEANTSRVVGTYGYMSPEYAVDGLFSMKSDVFSFGVLVLEIVSGKKNRRFSHPDHHHNLLGHAWLLWMEGKPMDLIDNMFEFDDSCALSEVIRSIQVGLLCVQQRPEDRPNMSSVVLMLGSEISLPQPKQPGFFTERDMPEPEFSSSSKLGSSSVNKVTITLMEAR